MTGRLMRLKFKNDSFPYGPSLTGTPAESIRLA
jgi:hypothetical protein